MMSTLAELVRRTERLQHEMERLRHEVEELRQDLLRLDRRGTEAQGEGPAAPDCLAAAIALAQDLGPGFSSEHPHDLAERGNDWFSQP